MIKYLSRHGNSLALVIERSILELLGIDRETALSVTTDGRALIISKARKPSKRAAVRRAVRKSLRRYRRAYERLADS